jgi:uncharacterized protein
MKYRTMKGAGPKYLGLGALLLSLVAPWAVAGPEQDSATAEKAFARGDLVVSLQLWAKAGQQGYAPAQARLGDLLDASEENEQAVDWYRKAADQGNAAGEFGLGQMYLKGEGVKKDVEQARVYILKAAEKNYLDAVTMMMYAYRSGGLGLAVDNAQADAWETKLMVLLPTYKKAAAKTTDTAKKGNAR